VVPPRRGTDSRQATPALDGASGGGGQRPGLAPPPYLFLADFVRLGAAFFFAGTRFRVSGLFLAAAFFGAPDFGFGNFAATFFFATTLFFATAFFFAAPSFPGADFLADFALRAVAFFTPAGFAGFLAEGRSFDFAGAAARTAGEPDGADGAGGRGAAVEV